MKDGMKTADKRRGYYRPPGLLYHFRSLANDEHLLGCKNCKNPLMVKDHLNEAHTESAPTLSAAWSQPAWW